MTECLTEIQPIQRQKISPCYMMLCSRLWQKFVLVSWVCLRTSQAVTVCDSCSNGRITLLVFIFIFILATRKPKFVTTIVGFILSPELNKLFARLTGFWVSGLHSSPPIWTFWRQLKAEVCAKKDSNEDEDDELADQEEGCSILNRWLLFHIHGWWANRKLDSADW